MTNLLMTEWDRVGKTVLTVATHKTGDKEPASVVIEDNLAELMHR